MRYTSPESERMLREESESDSSLRAQHGTKWSRTPSDKLTGTFTANATKYRTIINNATQADSMVKEKLSTHMAGMQVKKALRNSNIRIVSCRLYPEESLLWLHSFLRDLQAVGALALPGQHFSYLSIFSKP